MKIDFARHGDWTCRGAHSRFSSMVHVNGSDPASW
jgi:hypothetical protein